ncbi:MAG: sigma-70 family RNA polymerase sigma factor [Minisyncoccia bacterium]
MPTDDISLTSLTRQKNYDTKFDTLEKDTRYTALTYLARAGGAGDLQVTKLLTSVGLPEITPDAIRMRARYVVQKDTPDTAEYGDMRDAYHAKLREAYDRLDNDKKSEYLELTDAFLRAEVGNKYWQHEPIARALVYHLLKKNIPLGLIGTAVSLYFGSTVKGATIREALKHAGKDILLARLSDVTDKEHFSQLEPLADTYVAKARAYIAETRKYKSVWNAVPKNRALAQQLYKAGVSPQGVAYLIEKHTTLIVPTVSMKSFLQRESALPTLSQTDTAWIESILASGPDEYRAEKKRNYTRGAEQRNVPLRERKLCAEYYAPLLAYARRIHPLFAEELTQLTFMKLVVALRNGFRPWKNASLMPWLKVVCENASMDEFRKRKPETGHDVYTIENYADPLADSKAPTLLYDAERSYAILSALQTLPDEQREIARLKFYEDLSEVEVARRLDVPLGTVKSRWRLASQKLKVLLEDFDDFEDT